MSASVIAGCLDNQWLGSRIEPFNDPWYRFSRVLSVVDAASGIRGDDRWLDLGCHQGQLVTILQRLYGVRAVGVDHWTSDGRVPWPYYQRDLEGNWDLPNGRYRFISALEVLEHMTDTDAFLRQCKKHLEPNGLLILTTPNINSLKNRIRVPFGSYPHGLEYRNVIHHVRLYNLAALAAHLRTHGFEPIALEGVTLIPQRFLKSGAARRASQVLCRWMPQFASNMLVVSANVS